MAEPISINGPAVAPPDAKTRDYREAHQVRIRAAATRPSDPPAMQKAMTRLNQIMESGRYVEGLREGWWEFYDFEGRKDRRTGWYERGRRVR